MSVVVLRVAGEFVQGFVHGLSRQTVSGAILSIARTITKNFVAMLTSTVATRLLALVAVAYLARTLGVERFGQWSFAFTVANYFGMLVHLGLDVPAARYLVQKRGQPEQLIRWALPLKLGGALLGLLGATAAAVLLPGQPRETRWLIVACYVPLALAATNLAWVYLWLEKVHRFAASQVIEQALFLAALLAIVHGAEQVVRVPLAAGLAACGVAAVSWAWWQRDGHGFRWEWDTHGMRSLLREGIPITLSRGAVQLYLGCSVLILGLYSGNTQVALYNVGYRIAATLAVLRMTLITSLNPTFWRLYVESKEQLATLGNAVARYCACALVPVATLATVLSDPLVRLIFGAEYSGGGPVLALLSWWVTITFLTMSGEMILYTAARQDAILKLGVGSLLTAVALNLLWVPRWGAVGAASAMLATELVLLPVRFHLARRCAPVAFWQSLAKPCVSAAVAGAWLWFFRHHILWLHLPVALAIYLAALRLTGAVTVAELRQWWRALRGR
ncbi:MAG: flippase [Verrucomicrobiae bacterium]|nr:flippase [Verrucomicrobiae bacterium]